MTNNVNLIIGLKLSENKVGLVLTKTTDAR